MPLASQGDIDQLSKPTFASAPRHRAEVSAVGCVSITPRQIIPPRSSITLTAVRLKPTSSPANIFIAALLPLLEESHAERLAFPPENNSLVHGMYKTNTRIRARWITD